MKTDVCLYVRCVLVCQMLINMTVACSGAFRSVEQFCDVFNPVNVLEACQESCKFVLTGRPDKFIAQHHFYLTTYAQNVIGDLHTRLPACICTVRPECTFATFKVVLSVSASAILPNGENRFS